MIEWIDGFTVIGQMIKVRQRVFVFNSFKIISLGWKWSELLRIS